MTDINLAENSLPMSRREKCAWVCFLTTAAVYIPYFWYIVGRWKVGDLQVDTVLWACGLAVVIQTILSIAAVGIFLARDRSEPVDERELALAARSYRYAYFVLASGAFATVLAAPIIFARVFNAAITARSAILGGSQIVLACFIVAELTRYAVVIIGYRRGN